MAILIDGTGVVAQVEAVDSRYPGGWQEFCERISWPVWCQDGELLTLHFANLEEANICAHTLEQSGLIHDRDGKAVDFALVDQVRGPLLPTDWLNFGQVSFDGQVVRGAWKSNKEFIDVPEGWRYQGSLSERLASGQKLLQGPAFPRIAMVMHEGRPGLVDPVPAMIPEIDALLREAGELKARRPRPAEQLARIHDRLQTFLPRLVHECDGPESHDIPAHCVWGMVSAELGQNVQALRAYQTVERLAPGDTTALKMVAECALAVEENAEAVRAARRLTEINPAHSYGWAFLAEGLFRLGDTKEAAVAINRAIEQDPLSLLFQLMKTRFDPEKKA